MVKNQIYFVVVSCFNLGVSHKYCLCCQLPEFWLGKEIKKWEWNRLTSLHKKHTFQRV